MITRPLIFLLVLTSTVVVRGELQLKGILMSEGKPLFSLHSTEDQTSKWIGIGQSFGEFKATEFDAISDTLTVQNGAVRRSLKLQSSAIKVTTADRRAMLVAQQNSLFKELEGVMTKRLELRQRDPKAEESAELAALTRRMGELEVSARELDRALTELSRVDASLVQKVTVPPPSSQ